MATANHAQAVKSLNQGPGRRRYVFKTFSQRIDEIDIDVFKSLVPLQSEPSENSTFFRDCLVEWRELNTAEDFISFYEEMMPLVQTLPQIILHKEMILSALISRLQIQGRLSLEPILRLIAALSRDLLEDFPPFLQMIADSLASLLKSGADREPEIIEQIFTSWSYIMMYLQKYLVRDTVHVLRVTAELRYYPQEYVREFMAQSVSFLLRNAPVEQLKRGIKKVMIEVAKEPLRQTGVSALMWHVMRGTSLKLHSRAKLVLQLLLNNSMFDNGDKFQQGSESVLEVVTEILQRVCEELDPSELNLMWGCLYEEITGAASSGSLIHLRRLLSMMVSTVQVEYIRKLSDYQQLFQVVFELMQKFVSPSTVTNEEDQFSGVVDRILELMLCILDGLHLADNASFIRSVAVQWAPVFKLRNTSLLVFVRQLLLKDSQVVRAFSNDIISALDGLIEKNKEEVVFLLFMLCEKLNIRGRNSSFQGVGSRDGVSRICSYLENAIVYWTGNINKFINGESAPIGLCESKLALVWGVISCYSCMKERQSSPALLLAVVDALDQHLVVESEDVASSAKKACQALIGAALSCCNELLTEIGFSSELVSKFLPLARRYRSSPQVLSGVADFLDSVDRSQFQGGSSKSVFHPWLQVENIMDSLPLFAKNLCHPDKAIRLSTLRILCHYVSLNYEHSLEDRLTEENTLKSDIQVFHHLLSIEETQLSVSTGRSVCLLVSRIQTDLNAGRVSDAYLPSVFYGLIGIFHNRFSEFWKPTMECLAFLIRNKFNVIGDIIIQYLEECQSDFLKQCQSHVLTSLNTGSPSKPTTDLLCRFRTFVSPQCDSTPSTTVLCLLIESLQKVADVKGLWTKDIVPLFLNFMGYNSGVASAVSFNPDLCKGKEWTRVLKEWLNLLKLNGRPKLLKGSEFLKEVLQYRLLDEIDAEIQMSALDCLLQWKDNYLLPYEKHLKNLINSITMREEMAIWSLSRESDLIQEGQKSDLIEECHESDLIKKCPESDLIKKCPKSDFIKKCHRDSLMPILIRVLVPKVRKPKILTTQKHTSVHHRKTVLGFLAQLDVNELRLFFGLLINPMLSLPQGVRGIEDLFGNSSENSVEFDSSSVLVYFTLDNIATLSWKQRSGFLHVIEDILLVFDKFHIEPFLDLLLGCVVRMLASCMSDLGSDGSSGLIIRDNNEGAEDKIKNKPISKPSKELRSLCLKIISLVLNKYEEHQFDIEFWDMFFASVKPLTVCFKQGGASSEKPSSLFSCFLAMSRSFKLVSFLYKEQNLVPDIFSILTVQSASEAIISCVLEFVENLLNLGDDVDNEDSVIKKLLLPNVDTLICSLHSHFKFNNPARRKLIKHPGEREINIFKLLSKYVKDPSAAGKFVDIMLPLLTTDIQNSDACLEALQVIQSIVQVLAKESTPQILGALSNLLVSAGVDIRKSICDLLDSLAASDSSVLVLAKFIRELNATSAMEIGGLDLDVIINAYRKIDKDLFYTIGERQTVVILSHAVHDMSSSETILRESAYGLLVSFVEFSAVILDGQLMDCDQNSLPEACTGIITKFLLRHAGNAMSKDGSSRGVWIDLLRLMVLKLPKVQRLQSFRALCNEDAEQDFFYNIKHVQKHRVARALLRFKGFVSASELSLVTANKVFLPLFLDMLLNLPNGKGENVRSACIEALASISSKMEWPSYYAFLKRCFGEMEMKSDKKKVLLRLICSVLDHFHFLEINSREEAGVSHMDVSNADATDTTVPTALPARGASNVSEIQSCLRKDILPKIQKLLDSDSDNVNVNVSLLALKLLKLLPGDVMELQLPGIIQRISNFLKHRLESIRDEARLALSACLKELGLEYLKFILRVLNATLKRGYELHVLGYTLNSILSKYLVHPTSGKLDYCLEELLSVVENDILGDVSEQKEVEKIASKMKETGKCKSFETLKLVAQNITFKTHALKLLSPVTANMKKYLTPKLKSKLESMLKNIADGIECNPSVDQTDMFIFIYGLIEDTTKHTKGSPADVNVDKWSGKGAGRKAGTSSKLIDVGPEHCHLITGFAFGLLYNCLKRKNINKKDERLLSMLDPFVRMLTECLTSKFEGVIEKSLKCLALVVGLPLPSLESVAENMKTSVLLIAQNSTDSSGSLVQPCLSLLTVLLRKTRITLSADQLHMIIQFPVFVDLEKNSSFGALSLLKAIVNRKLVVPEIYDLVTRVAELMVTNQVESFRRKCSQILLQFLLDYQLSEKRLQQHLDFLLSNLRYEHSAGRESVLEMIHAIVMKFPKVILDEHSRTIFLNLVMCLSNDHDKKVRLMTGAAIKLLIGRVSPHSKHSILEYSLSWYLSKNQQLWGAAAQVLGLLVEAMKKDFGKHVNEVLVKMKTIFHSAVNVLTDPELDHSNDARIPLWKEAYYSLVMLEKILNQFPDTCLSKDLEDTWEIICEFLVHPHLWLRNVSNRLMAFYFASVSAASKESCEKSLGSFYLMRPSRLLLIVLYLCCQLKGTIDNAGSALVIQNLAFTLCYVHSFLQTHNYWSTLDAHEEGRLLKAFQLLDSGKGKSVFTSLTSLVTTESTQEDIEQRKSLLLSYLLRRMGKIALQTESAQMQVVFSILKSISPKIIGSGTFHDTDDSEGYAYQIMLPLYKVCEGYAGRVIPDDVKQIAQEALDSVKDALGANYSKVYMQVAKSLKGKREKRRQGEKVLAVVDPMRNAKRKLRIAAKSRANKKRKIMTMRIAKWMH